ncbi:hypothetical protein FKM82_027077 [Ascaphus truei]
MVALNFEEGSFLTHTSLVFLNICKLGDSQMLYLPYACAFTFILTTVCISLCNIITFVFLVGLSYMVYVLLYTSMLSCPYKSLC